MRVNPRRLVRALARRERQKRDRMVAGRWLRTQTLGAWNPSPLCALRELSLCRMVPLVRKHC